MYFAKLLLCISISVVAVNSARILAWVQTPSISHQSVFRPFTQELAKRGHEVVVITTDPAFPRGRTPKNLTEIDVHDMSYNYLSKIGALDKVTAGLALAKVLKVPIILVMSSEGFTETYDIMGAPSRPPLIYPTHFTEKINKLSLTDKIIELYNNYEVGRLFESMIEMENNLVKKYFGDDIPDLRDLKSNVDLFFLNVNPIWSLNRPVPPGIVYLGGMHQVPEKPLPKDLKSYLDSSKHGVIYVSYGNNVKPSLLNAEKIQLLVKVFSELPYDILWKWDNDVLPGRTNNIKISKWFPQSDLLRHPNVKVFITQGGLQSTDEAITAGVPLLGMPVHSDQYYNVELYVRYKIGLRIDMESLTENEFKDAVLTLINNQSYTKNVVKLRKIMQDQPQTPLERAVWWTEYVLRHGGAKHLRAPAANMNWTEYLDVELLAVLSGIVLAVLVMSCVTVRIVYRVIKRQLISASKMKKC